MTLPILSYIPYFEYLKETIGSNSEFDQVNFG